MSWLRRALAYCNLASPQVFTGAVPFNDSLPTVAMLAIMGGKRPSRPTHPALTDELWILIEHCWNQDPRSRPEVSEVLQVLPNPSVSHPFQLSSIREPDSFLVYSMSPPAWKLLIDHHNSTDKRISLLTSTVTNPDEVEIVERLCGNDAQVLIDVINEVNFHICHV